MTRTRAEIGRTNRTRGIHTERDVARYLRVCGWPHAERKVDTGWAALDRTSRDAGDIRNTPRLCWQVKSSPDLSGERLARAMRETGDQAVAAGADYGILVHRRAGRSSPGVWWAYLPIGDLAVLAIGDSDVLYALDEPARHAARVELGDLIPLLHRAGYGETKAA